MSQEEAMTTVDRHGADGRVEVPRYDATGPGKLRVVIAVSRCVPPSVVFGARPRSVAHVVQT